MKAGIIAAGDGTRFVENGIDVPKPLLKVADQSLLARTISQLCAAQVSEIALITNERFSSIAVEAERLAAPTPVKVVIETTPSSMHSLLALKPHLSDDRFILCTVDSIIPPAEFAGFISHFSRETSTEVLLSYTDFIDDEKPLRLGVGQNDQVDSLGEDAAGSPFVTVGLYGMSPRVFDFAPRAHAQGLSKLRKFLGLLLSAGLKVQGYRLSKAIDVDRPHDLAVAEAFIKQWPRL